MKKLTALFLAILLCFSFAACGGNAEPDTTEPSAKEETEGFPEWELHEDGYYVISEEEFASYLTEYEITTENWQDFFSVKEFVEYNAFGEIEKTYKMYGLYVPCWSSDDFAVEISNGEESEIIATPVIATSKFNENFSNLTCLRAQGKIIVAEDVPDELWRTYDNHDAFAFKYTKESNGEKTTETRIVLKQSNFLTSYEYYANLANNK